MLPPNMFDRIRDSISSHPRPKTPTSHTQSADQSGQQHQQQQPSSTSPSLEPPPYDVPRRTSLDPASIGYKYTHTAQNFPKPPFVGEPPLRRGKSLGENDGADGGAHELPSYSDAKAETEEDRKTKDLRAMKEYFERQRDQAGKDYDPALTFRQM